MPDSAVIDASIKKGRESSFPLKAMRRITQVAMLGVIGQWSFYGIFRCPFPVPYVSCQNCPVITCHGRIFTLFWGFWLLLPLSALLFGRAFCGWMCPGGLVNQVFGKLAPLKLRVRNTLTRLLSMGPYAGLIVTVAAFFCLGQPRANIPIRLGSFFESVYLTFEHSGMLWLVRSFIVLGILLLGVLVANAWCRFACPTGGLLESVKRMALFRFFKTDECNDCEACRRVCEMGTRPEEANCTNCGDCLDICPQDAIRFGKRRS